MNYDNKGHLLISIIVAVFNGAKTLQRCIDSIATQTYQYKELIIMDGGSTDGTVSILERNNQMIKYWESKDDRGIAHAWNKAIGKAKGDWILFLGADDYLNDENVLLDMSDFLCNDANHDIVYGKIIFEGGGAHGLVAGSDSNLNALKRRMIIPHTAAFHRLTFFEEVGNFDESFRMAMDYEVLLRKKALSAIFIDRRVTVMGGEGVSSVLIRKTLIEGRSAQLNNRVDRRVVIEFWHLFYQLRHWINSSLEKGGCK